MHTILDLVNNRATETRNKAEAIANRAAAEGRGMTDTETLEFDEHTRQLATLVGRANELRTEGTGASGASTTEIRSAGVGGAIVRSEPHTYAKFGEHSMVRDHMMVAIGRADRDVHDRLNRHAREVAIETRAGSTTDNAGGTFTPPLWVVNEYVGVQRPGRVVADLARQFPMPGGTDAISIPTITTGTVTDVQATENSAATTRDLVTSSTTADVTTIAGTYDFSLQQLEQSALSAGWDAMVFADLSADYNRRLDTLVLDGTGANNQPPGIYTVAGTTVYASSTSATTAQNQIFQGVADAINRVATTRYGTPEVIVMHPRRWFWLCSRLDLDGRPVIVPDAAAGQNLLAAMGITASQGIVGTMLGLPVAIDANVSTSAGTSEDRIAVWKASDAMLWEGTPKFEVFRSVLGGTTDTLTARARLYAYSAFSSRYTTATALVGGTALSSPTY